MDHKTELNNLFHDAKQKHLSLRALSSQIRKQNPSLWKWIEENCDNTLSKKHHAKKIYSALHDRFKFVCPHGFEIGLTGSLELYFPPKMKLSDKCDCYKNYKTSDYYVQKEKIKWDRYNQTMANNHGVEHPFQKEEIKQKARKTNLQKYGVEFPSQLDTFEKKKQQTNLERRGVKHPLQDKSIADKYKLTNLERYGKTNSAQEHISPLSFEVLENPSELEKLIQTNGVLGAADMLGVHRDTIYNRIRKYGFDYLVNSRSSYEDEIQSFLDDLGINYKKNDRTICKPKELDFLLEDKKLAIEFDGFYFHCENGGCDKNYHSDKTKICSENGINLLHIFEDEWLERKNICKSIIKNRIGICDKTIPARKCIAQEVENRQLRSFLETNHLQGFCRAKRAFVLVFENEIVAAMTFSKPRFNKKIEWELVRLSIKCGVNIIGGVEKLWKYALKKICPKTIVSYCDRRWFNGTIYEKLGFKSSGFEKNSYWYTKNGRRYHRANFQKHKLVAMGYSSSLTEKQITQNMGYDRIWDCGQDTWIWTT